VFFFVCPVAPFVAIPLWLAFERAVTTPAVRLDRPEAVERS
jgi:hypothetical protein